MTHEQTLRNLVDTLVDTAVAAAFKSNASNMQALERARVAMDAALNAMAPAPMSATPEGVDYEGVWEVPVEIEDAINKHVIKGDWASLAVVGQRIRAALAAAYEAGQKSDAIAAHVAARVEECVAIIDEERRKLVQNIADIYGTDMSDDSRRTMGEWVRCEKLLTRLRNDIMEPDPEAP